MMNHDEFDEAQRWAILVIMVGSIVIASAALLMITVSFLT